MREELVEAVLRVVEEIPEGRVATYGMIARAVGTGPRVVGRIMHDWGGGVPWWRVVNVHDDCVVEQEWLDGVARLVVEKLQTYAEM